MAFQRKFQNGDKVRVIKEFLSYYGEVGTVKGYTDSEYLIEFTNINGNLLCRIKPTFLEKVETETKSAEVTIPLELGQEVTLLDGKKYKVIKGSCRQCILSKNNPDNEGISNCHLTHINGARTCDCVIKRGASLDSVCFARADTTKDQKVKFPLKVGQVVTLHDCKKYIISEGKGCSTCALSPNKCQLCYIEGRTDCIDILGEEFPNRCFKEYKPTQTNDPELKESRLQFKLGDKVILRSLDETKKRFNVVPKQELYYKDKVPLTICSVDNELEICVAYFEKDFILTYSTKDLALAIDGKLSIPRPIEPIQTVQVTKTKFSLLEFKSERIGRKPRTIL